MKKYQKIVACILILLGIALALAQILVQINHCAYMWEIELKARNFDTFWNYFFSCSGGAILLAIITGSIPVIAGIELFYK